MGTSGIEPLVLTAGQGLQRSRV
ncbi:hypothetical protein SCOCK_90014 [Actinacidiphila cocklensis]|uniref:Uncharacterized protein n=1 Tax=Actinacidiphila cocklensis TaxID=887465 RepID=A0A9W4E1K4_9ACTN|nr:hypothetical protein SCOCK_90014 [Actinacidiphila cocklensis]